MKRISFKDIGGLHLTQAVLSGRKTMTRRAVTIQVYADAIEYARYESDSIRAKFEYILKHSPYKVGDVVAIQQAYNDVFRELFCAEITQTTLKRTAGWRNKMFVKAELMPHHIRITDVRVEQLQLIPYEDCLREGIIKDNEPYSRYFFSLDSWYSTPTYAFADLIDKVSGRGTWESNPLVWVYSFELVD